MATLDDNAPLTDLQPLGLRPGIEERVVRAGSRARAARRAAASYACERLMPGEAAASFPAPVAASTGPGLSFMLCLSAPDLTLRDYVLYAPELAVTVHHASLKVVGCQVWRTPVNPLQEKFLTPWQPARARQLPGRHRDALENELFLLCDQIAPLFWKKSTLSEAERVLVARFDRLFRFLVPEALLPGYVRLSPAFFAWLAADSGAGDGDGAGSTPAPRPGLLPPPRLLPDPWLSLVPDRAWDPETDPFNSYG
jgi:hypothetical protein